MDLNFLIQLIVLMIVVGLLCYSIQRIPGLPPPIPVVIQILVVLVFAVFILDHMGLFTGYTGHGAILHSGCG